MEIIWQYLPTLLKSIGVTFSLVLPTLVMGFCIALLFTFIHYKKIPVLTQFISAYSFFIRGTPLLVQIFLLYYGFAQFEWVREQHLLWWVLSSPTGCAILAFTLSTSAYTFELLKSAVNNVPKEYVEAGKALSFSDNQIFKIILFPIAFRNLLPSYVNEITLVIKGSSLASTITVLDLMGMTQKIIGETYATVEFFLAASVLYLCINGAVMLGFKTYISYNQRKYSVNI